MGKGSIHKRSTANGFMTLHCNEIEPLQINETGLPDVFGANVVAGAHLTGPMLPRQGAPILGLKDEEQPDVQF